MEVFLFSFNAIAPMLLPALLGWLIMRRGHLDDRSIGVLNTICFRYLLAFHVFNSTYKIDFYADFNPKLLIFCALSITAVMLAGWLIMPRLIQDRARRCSFIISAFRSNNIIYALPLAVNLFGDSGIKVAAMLVPVSIILFNFYSVIIFVYYSNSGDTKGGITAALKRTALDTVRNPLLLGSILGIVLSLLRVDFPAFLRGGIDNVAVSATPLSLMLLGAQMDLKKLGGNLGQLLTICAMRLVLVPVIMVPLAAWLGFRGPELGALMVVFAAPAAVTNLVMARNYKVDAEFTAQTVILSTVLSMGTIFVAISLLRGLGLF